MNDQLLNGEIIQTKPSASSTQGLSAKQQLIAAAIGAFISFFGGRATAYIEAPANIEATSQRLAATVTELTDFKKEVRDGFQKLGDKLDTIAKKQGEQ